MAKEKDPVLDEQAEDIVAEVELDTISDMLVDDSTVTIEGRVFELGVPSTRSIIWFLNAFSSLARRSQGKALDMLGSGSPNPLDVIFGIGEAITEQDLVEFGVAALQFNDRKKGRKFLRDAGVPMAEIIQAMGISIKKSSPLMAQLKNVLEGLVGKGTIEALIETTVQESLQ